MTNFTVSSTPRCPSLREGIAGAANRLQSCGVPSPRHDAEAIAAHLLRVPSSELWRHLDEQIPKPFSVMVEERARRVPLQHLTGYSHFRHETLRVGPGVFIPRPETEVVVEEALRLLERAPVPAPTVVDLGSGSGAIARSIATECDRAQVHAVEADLGAVPWLKANVEPVGVFVHAVDMRHCLRNLNGQVDLVIANPPYIPIGSRPVDPEVADHDPCMALYSGSDGLDHIRLVEQTSTRLLRSGGWVVVEHADRQGSTAPAIFRSTGGWTDVSDHQDLTRRDRFVTARRADNAGWR